MSTAATMILTDIDMVPLTVAEKKAIETREHSLRVVKALKQGTPAGSTYEQRADFLNTLGPSYAPISGRDVNGWTRMSLMVFLRRRGVKL